MQNNKKTKEAVIKGLKYRLFHNIFHSFSPLEIWHISKYVVWKTNPHFNLRQMKWHLMQLYPVRLPNLCGLAVVGNCSCPAENNNINMKTKTSKFNINY